MTTPNKFEAAGRLLTALHKLEAKRIAKLARVVEWTAVERERLLAAADPEARALVLATEREEAERDAD